MGWEEIPAHSATAINDDGQIVANALDIQTGVHALFC